MTRDTVGLPTMFREVNLWELAWSSDNTVMAQAAKFPGIVDFHSYTCIYVAFARSMACFTAYPAMFCLLPTGKIFLMTAITANVVHVINGQACPLFSILFTALWIKAVFFQRSWCGHYSGHYHY
jgi:hypothetical protein